MTGNVIEARGVCKSFGEVAVLNGIDLTVQHGTMLALLGPNGAGKTTMVRILSTLLKPDGGTVLVDGLDVVRQSRAVRGRIGLTGQDTAVDGVLTGRENLVMMGRLFHLDRDGARQRAAELLTLFDLAGVADRPAKTYSGGIRRRLDLAVSLITAPPVLFLDEPTTGLDPRSRQSMQETIRKLLSTGTTILLTTQYLDEADQLADSIAVIDRGRIVAEGTADQLKRQVGTERLELAFATEDDAERARKLVAGVRLDGPRISVMAGDATEVRRLLNEIADTGLRMLDIALHRPTLDDVFLTLTGRDLGAPQ
jgi:daunorubicin resistance ABC transporter ATP-binding subunit